MDLAPGPRQPASRGDGQGSDGPPVHQSGHAPVEQQSDLHGTMAQTALLTDLVYGTYETPCGSIFEAQRALTLPVTMAGIDASIRRAFVYTVRLQRPQDDPPDSPQ